MAKNRFPLLFVKDINENLNYSSPRSSWGTAPKLPFRNRVEHGERIKEKLQEVWLEFENANQLRKVASFDTKDGIFLEFRSHPDHDLITKSLEHIGQGIRILNVKEIESPEGIITSATVYIPNSKKSFFLQKVNDYLEKESRSGKPINKNLIEGIEEIRIAFLNSFWQGKLEDIPNETPKWCEVWIRCDENNSIDEVQFLKEICEENEISFKEQLITFPERKVFLINADRNQLNELIQLYDYLAEIRKSFSPISFWFDLSNFEQQQWVDYLSNRLVVSDNDSPSILILDTGINNGHKLISPFLKDEDLHTFDQEWGVGDKHGHGTMMSGIAIFGDLSEALLNSGPIHVGHLLESGKILPNKGENDKHLYGYITRQLISLAEIQAPNRNRIICLASAEFNENSGRPSSWSGSLDAISSGYYDNVNRLIITSAGNVDSTEWHNYSDSNLLSQVESPGQAWNVLTVGAFTNKSLISDPKLSEYNPIAPPGGLSPVSKTSVTWEKKWPIKPDVLFEGGNIAIRQDGFTTECDDLSLLTTNHQPLVNQFNSFSMTSAATAQAARMAAIIQNEYPNAWPETTRALIVHSAEWNDILKQQFKGDSNRKKDFTNLLRVCGYGIPNLDKALYCSENHLTLIAQEKIQPFAKTKTGIKVKDMHFYDLPWPEEILLEMSSTPVKMRVTLSYFIEPGPGEIGWKDKYRYRSHALKFDVNTKNEDRTQFVKRINAAAREEGENGETPNDTERWVLGDQNRSLGSIHSDFMEVNAADLATCKYIGIYPLIGWWKERGHLKQYNKVSRYTLIISLETPEMEIDLYTPVASKLKIPIITL